jgi:hypothetical protein
MNPRGLRRIRWCVSPKSRWTVGPRRLTRNETQAPRDAREATTIVPPQGPGICRVKLMTLSIPRLRVRRPERSAAACAALALSTPSIAQQATNLNEEVCSFGRVTP